MIYALFAVICLFFVPLYNTSEGKLTCFLSAFFFYISAIYTRLPSFDSEILLYFLSVVVFSAVLFRAGAHRYFIVLCFSGGLAHIFGYLSYASDYHGGLVVYNELVSCLNILFIILIAAQSNAGSYRLNQIGDFLSRALLSLGKS